MILNLTAPRPPAKSSQKIIRRARALAPYLLSAPKRGVVGNSPYADRLRKGVIKAARDELR